MFPGPGKSTPALIARACKLLLLSLALGVITLIPSIGGHWWASPDSGVPDSLALAFGLSFMSTILALHALLIYLTYTRRNWARWTLLALLMCNWVLLVRDFPRLQADTPMAALWDAASMGLALTACYLLFFSRDAAWFSRR